MRNWLLGVALALVFATVGAFAASLWIEIRSDAPPPLEPASGLWEGRRIRVEVLNGAGVDGLARLATERLRGWGFDVVYYGNADEFDRDSSVAIARVESVEPARRVADALGLQKVVLRPDENLYLDVTVILGGDWLRRDESITEPEAADAGGLWAKMRSAARRLVGE